MKRTVLLLVTLLLVSGCVSSGKYQKSLSEIDDLNREASDLREELGASKAGYAELESSYREVVREKEALSAEKSMLIGQIEQKELARTADIRRLQQEKAEAIKQKDREKELELERSIQALEREKELELERSKKTYNALIGELKNEIRKGEIAITSLKDKLTLSIIDKVLFDSGSANVKKEGKEVLDRVAGILKNITDKEIKVEGHTDNVPIGPRLAGIFPTNWELSTARATNVVRYLQEKGGIDPVFLSASGYSEYKPVAPNDAAEGRARNRRIEIILVARDVERIKIERSAPAE